MKCLATLADHRHRRGKGGDRAGYRAPMVLAHVLCVAGLVLVAVLPFVLPSPYLDLCLVIVVYAIGGGLLEVLLSLIVE